MPHSTKWNPKRHWLNLSAPDSSKAISLLQFRKRIPFLPNYNKINLNNPDLKKLWIWGVKDLYSTPLNLKKKKNPLPKIHFLKNWKLTSNKLPLRWDSRKNKILVVMMNYFLWLLCIMRLILCLKERIINLISILSDSEKLILKKAPNSDSNKRNPLLISKSKLIKLWLLLISKIILKKIWETVLWNKDSNNTKLKPLNLTKNHPPLESSPFIAKSFPLKL